jgi:hypothetical protein
MKIINVEIGTKRSHKFVYREIAKLIIKNNLKVGQFVQIIPNKYIINKRPSKNNERLLLELDIPLHGENLNKIIKPKMQRISEEIDDINEEYEEIKSKKKITPTNNNNKNLKKKPNNKNNKNLKKKTTEKPSKKKIEVFDAFPVRKRPYNKKTFFLPEAHDENEVTAFIKPRTVNSISEEMSLFDDELYC